MKNIANLKSRRYLDHDSRCVGEEARVTYVMGNKIMVQIGGEIIAAKKSFSCLVEPQSSDRVLVSLVSGDLFILSILEREISCDIELSCQGDLTFRAQNGKFLLESQGRVSIHSSVGVDMLTDDLKITANKTSASLGNTGVTGTVLSSFWRDAKTIAETVTTVASRSVQALESSFRVISGLDQTKSREHIHSVQESSVIRANDVVLTARDDIKIDGNRIHMG